MATVQKPIKTNLKTITEVEKRKDTIVAILLIAGLLFSLFMVGKTRNELTT